MLNTKYNDNFLGFDILSNNKKLFTLGLPQIISAESRVTNYVNITSVTVHNDYVLTVFDNDQNIELIFIKNKTYNDPISISFNNETKISKINKYTGQIKAQNKKLFIYSSDTWIESCENNIITFNGDKPEIRIVLGLKAVNTAEIKAMGEEMVFRAMASGSGQVIITPEEYVYTIPVGQPIPEFSIALYDDSDYSILRPFYNGSHVLSTISTQLAQSGTDAYKMGDAHYYSLGFGPSARATYLNVKCTMDIRIPKTFEIYLVPPDTQPLLRIIKISSGEILYSATLVYYENNQYRISFDFNQSWGDGEILLFDIYIKMRIYNFLPISFSVGQSGTNEQPLFNIFSE